MLFFPRMKSLIAVLAAFILIALPDPVTGSHARADDANTDFYRKFFPSMQSGSAAKRKVRRNRPSARTRRATPRRNRSTRSSYVYTVGRQNLFHYDILAGQSFRRKPGCGFKRSGEKLQVINRNSSGWLEVRVVGRSGKCARGFVHSKYVRNAPDQSVTRKRRSRNKIRRLQKKPVKAADVVLPVQKPERAVQPVKQKELSVTYQKPKLGEMKGHNVYLRKGATTQSGIECKLDRDAKFEILGKTENFYKIGFVDSKRKACQDKGGFVYADFVREVPLVNIPLPVRKPCVDKTPEQPAAVTNIDNLKKILEESILAAKKLEEEKRKAAEEAAKTTEPDPVAKPKEQEKESLAEKVKRLEREARKIAAAKKAGNEARETVKKGPVVDTTELEDEITRLERKARELDARKSESKKATENQEPKNLEKEKETVAEKIRRLEREARKLKEKSRVPAPKIINEGADRPAVRQPADQPQPEPAVRPEPEERAKDKLRNQTDLPKDKGNVKIPLPVQAPRRLLEKKDDVATRLQYIRVQGLRLRSEPSTADDKNVLCKLYVNDPAAVLKTRIEGETTWAEVKVNNGDCGERTGWITLQIGDKKYAYDKESKGVDIINELKYVTGVGKQKPRRRLLMRNRDYTSRPMFRMPRVDGTRSGGVCGSYHQNPDGGVLWRDAYVHKKVGCGLISMFAEWREMMDKENPGKNYTEQGYRIQMGDISNPYTRGSVSYYRDRRGRRRVRCHGKGIYRFCHQTHTRGLCIDFRPMRKKSRGFADEPVYVGDRNYDWKMTRRFIKFLKRNGFTKVLFNDRRYMPRGQRGGRMHSNHIHACMPATKRNFRRMKKRCEAFNPSHKTCPNLTTGNVR